MKKLLVVDDDPDILESMQYLLSSYGYASEVTLVGEEAYSKAQAYQPDLIILDFLLSGIHGSDVCRKLKATRDTRHIPILMFSAHPEAKNYSESCGAEDFIAKPFNITHLMEKVNQLLGEA